MPPGASSPAPPAPEGSRGDPLQPPAPHRLLSNSAASARAPEAAAGPAPVTLLRRGVYTDMADTLPSFEARARRAYEWGRLRRAALGAVPVALLVGAAAAATTELVSTVAVGLGLYLLGLFALWYGQGLNRALLPGVLAGTLPLALALCATHAGHAWLGDWCTPVCLAACGLGGAGGGLLVGSWARRYRAPAPVAAAAALFGISTGTMGSSCVGTAGVLLLAAGFAAALLFQLLRPAAPHLEEAP